MAKRTLISVIFILSCTIISFAQSADLISLDSIEINPNPYDANINNKDLYPGYIEFSHIPNPKAEINIHSIGGGLLRTLTKKEGEHRVLWFLRTEKNEPIESGVYLILVKVENVGERILTFYYKGKNERDPF